MPPPWRCPRRERLSDRRVRSPSGPQRRAARRRGRAARRLGPLADDQRGDLDQPRARGRHLDQPTSARPLPGREILRAKLVGAVSVVPAPRLLRIVGIIALGTVMGAFHPLGAAIAAAQMAAFGLFVVAAGTLISLRAKTTAAAIGTGVVLLLWRSACSSPLMIGSVSRPGPSAFATSHPVLFACGLLSHPNVEEVRAAFAATPHDRFHRRIPRGRLRHRGRQPRLPGRSGRSSSAWAYRRFDRVLDRPRRPVTATAPAHPTSAARGAGARASRPAGRAGSGPRAGRGRRGRPRRPGSRSGRPLPSWRASRCRSSRRRGRGLDRASAAGAGARRRPGRTANVAPCSVTTHQRISFASLRRRARSPPRSASTRSRIAALSSDSRSYEALMTSWRYCPFALAGPPALDRRVVEDPLDQPADGDDVVERADRRGRTRGGRR